MNDTAYNLMNEAITKLFIARGQCDGDEKQCMKINGAISAIRLALPNEITPRKCIAWRYVDKGKQPFHYAWNDGDAPDWAVDHADAFGYTIQKAYE